MVFTFSSCSGGDPENDESGGAADKTASYSAEGLLDEVLKNIPEDNLDTVTAKGDGSSGGFDAYCEKLYYTGSENISDGVIAYASSGGLADEISVLKPSDGCSSDELLALLQSRVQRRYEDFEGYKPDELDKIESAETFECGDFVVLIISDDAVRLKEEFLKFR